jgi:hypothetical protein
VFVAVEQKTTKQNHFKIHSEMITKSKFISKRLQNRKTKQKQKSETKCVKRRALRGLWRGGPGGRSGAGPCATRECGGSQPA